MRLVLGFHATVKVVHDYKKKTNSLLQQTHMGRAATLFVGTTL